MADTKGNVWAGKLVAAVICVGAIGLGVWMLTDPQGFVNGMDPDTGRAKAKAFKYSVGFLVSNLGTTGTGWLLTAVGVLGGILVLKPKGK
ncbi:MAG: hypothetical protein ACKVU4_15540 [Phycisphaerales bacterium]